MQIKTKIKRTFQALIDPKLSFFQFALFLFLLFLSNTIIFSYHTWAIGNIHFGSLEFHPVFNASEGYVDNVYLAPEGYEKSGPYRSYSSGLKCDWNKTKYRIQLSYLYEFLKYDNGEVNDRDLIDLDSKFDLRFGKNSREIDLDGGYRYCKTFEPYTSEQRADNRKERSAKFGLRLNMRDNFGISFNSKLIQHRFMDDALASKWNRDILKFSSKASIRPFTKTYILLEYGLIMSDYRDPNKPLNDDSKTHSLLTGLEWEATAELSGAMKVGYQWKKYNDPKGIRARSPETWKMEIDLKQTFSEFTFIQLGFERSIEDSDFRYAGQDAGFYYSNQIHLVLDHKLTYKIGIWIDIFYNYSDYSNVSRKDELWQFDMGLDYQFLDWIQANINYHSRIRNTNIHDLDKNDVPDTFDYRTNQFNVGLNLVF